MTRERFSYYVRRAVSRLPPRLRERIENVAFVIETEPSDGRRSLLGLYHGIPLTRRSGGYSAVLPDKITLFQKNIEEVAGPGPEERVSQLIEEVVRHEIAHYFGMDERRVRRWEKHRKSN